MVYESPAAGRPVACRKHSPWTMERDRKKSKARLGSPEPLSEEVEEEEEEPDDHEMTEQEVQVLADLSQLNVGSFLASQEDPDGDSLSRAGSVPDGQRRKLRGSRALSASYHNRLRSCVLNEKGSPLPPSSRSYTNGAGGGQENMAPIMFAPVMFADHSKCWLGRRHSPTVKDTSGGEPPQNQGTTGIAHPSNFQAHGLVLNTAADRSLLASAALASSSRSEKHFSCDSPAPKGRSHRRSLSGASVAAACGLNDSAEALHGPSEACAAGQGQQPQPCDWPHLRFASEGSAQRHGSTFRPGGAAGDDHNVDKTGQAAAGGPFSVQDTGDNTAGRNPNDLPNHARFPSSASALSSALIASTVCVAKYGIAAFGVPASVQSCFADPMAASTQHVEGGAAAGPAGPQHDLAPCTMSCPGDICVAVTAGGALGRHIAHLPGLASFSGGLGSAATSAAGLGSGPLLDLGPEPLADASSESFGGSGHVRHGAPPLGSGAGKALADSAEELELRWLGQQQPAVTWQPPRQGSLDGQQLVEPPPLLQIERQQSLRPGSAAHCRPASMGSSAAASAAAAAAASEPLPDTLPKPPLAPFDLISLARSAGSVFETANLTSFSTSGHFSTDAVQGAVGGPVLPQPFSLWPAPQGRDSCHGGCSLASGNNNSNQASKDAAGGSGAWPASAFANFNMKLTNSVLRAGAPGTAADCNAQQTGFGGQRVRGSPVLEHTSSIGDSGAQFVGDIRTDQGDGICDGEDGESWLRTSQQAPDPDDPSSAGKYSAVLLRRLQAAAEHEELFGVPASGGHAGAYSFFHLQGSCGSDYGLPSGSGGRFHLGSHGGSSSMEPSPLPRLSSRLRRLRASPCLGGSGGSGGPLTSPAPSHLLGTRSRSAGVTPGDVTCRRLRRRSDLVAPDQLGQGSVSARGHADVDELDDMDAAAADEHMRDAGHQVLSAGGSDDHVRILAARMGSQAAHRHHGVALPLHSRVSGSGLQFTASPELRSEPLQRILDSQAGGVDLAVGQLQHQHRLKLHSRNDYLSGLMDYEDDGVEYMTPPHTPLRGIGAAHDQDAATAPRAAFDGIILCGGAPNPVASAAQEGFFAIAPGRARLGPGKGVLPQRVTFASHRLGGGDTVPASPLLAAGGSYVDGSSCAQLLISHSLGSTQEFNRCLSVAANANDRGAAERLWQEMCSRGVTPDINTLNSLLRCLSRSAADPDEAHLLVRDVCSRGDFDTNGTSQRLLEEICFRFEQLNGSTL